MLGVSQRGACYLILSGSSEYLRGLVTGQHSIEVMKAHGFTHYMRDDLNGRKFVPIPIFPFLDHADFVGLVSLYRRSALSDHDLARLYLNSGAVPGNVSNLLSNPNSQINNGRFHRNCWALEGQRNVATWFIPGQAHVSRLVCFRSLSCWRK